MVCLTLFKDNSVVSETSFNIKTFCLYKFQKLNRTKGTTALLAVGSTVLLQANNDPTFM